MKQLFALLFACFFALTGLAQDRIPEPTPLQKWGFLNGIVAVTTGWFVLPGAMATGKRKELCDVMRGTYDPNAADQCKGGQWVFIVPYLKQLQD